MFLIYFCPENASILLIKTSIIYYTILYNGINYSSKRILYVCVNFILDKINFLNYFQQNICNSFNMNIF